MKKIILIATLTSFALSFNAFASKKLKPGEFPKTNCKISVSSPAQGRALASKGTKNGDKVYYVRAENKKECAQAAKWYEHMYSTVTGSDEPAEFEFISK